MDILLRTQCFSFHTQLGVQQQNWFRTVIEKNNLKISAITCLEPGSWARIECKVAWGKFWKMIEISYIMISVVVIWLNTFVKIHHTIDLKWMICMAYKLYLPKAAFSHSPLLSHPRELKPPHFHLAKPEVCYRTLFISPGSFIFHLF